MGLTSWRHARRNTPSNKIIPSLFSIIIWLICTFLLISSIIIEGFHFYHILFLLVFIFFTPFSLLGPINEIREGIIMINDRHKNIKKEKLQIELEDAVRSYLLSLDKEGKIEFYKEFYGSDSINESKK